MQNNTQYTRCPQCKTAFKVNEKMLSMAHGKVRCGACLEVFQANEHFLQPRAKELQSSPATPAESTTADSEPPAKVKTETTQSVNVDTKINVDPEITETGVSDPAADISNIHQDQTTLGEFDTPEDDDLGLSTEQASLDLAQMEPLKASDDFDDSAMLDDESEQNLTAESPGTHESASIGINTDESDDNFANPDIDEQDLDDFDIGSSDIGGSELEGSDFSEDFEDPQISFDDSETDLAIEGTLDSQEPAADSMVAERTTEEQALDDPSSVEQKVEEQGISIDAESLSDTLEHEESDWSNEDEDWSNEEEDWSAEEIGASLEQEADSFEPSLNSDDIAMAEPQELELLADNLVDQINDTDTEPDPLEEFEGRVEKKKTSLRTIVIGATALILVVFLSYNFWSNRQSLAWDETWGGLTKGICSVLPCDLKPRRDVAKIRLRQRIVTPSENKENHLDVKILLTNEASFAQPYPTITIKFSNSLGDQVATKKFSVAEYFPEKHGQMMPAGTEVHIAFETELPHPDALGFEFRFE